MHFPSLRTPADPDRFGSYFALCALVAIMAYQMGLCFLFTKGFPATNAIAGAVEVTILVLVLLRVSRQRPLSQLFLLPLIGAYFLLLWAIREGIDPFGPRDIAIMIFFFWLGQSAQSRKDANRIIWTISAMVLFFGFLEYTFTDQYLKVFDILHYYETRLQTGPIKYLHSNLFVSGTRTSGRNMFQFLGKQRVSSIFLEPVSMGNYAVIIAAWGLSFTRRQWKQGLAHLLAGAVFAIACDSRFATIMIVLLIAARMIPLAHKRWAILLVPLVTVAVVLSYTAFSGANPFQDTTSGRIAHTGVSTFALTPSELFGLDIPQGLYDEGIPYTFEAFGLMLCIALWAWLSLLKLDDPRAASFRAMLAVYAMGLLSISGTSFYSSKTATLLWFMMGTLAAGKGTDDHRNEATNAVSSIAT